jgi:serine/threonine protein phosphatase PrpC
VFGRSVDVGAAVTITSLSWRGRHPVNEDAFLVGHHPAHPQLVLCMLADGQGGQPGGQRAAQVACRIAFEQASSRSLWQLRFKRAWRSICGVANQAVTNDSQAGLTTLVALAVGAGRVVGASNGDSAAFAVSEDGGITDLTQHQVRNPPVGSASATFTPFSVRLTPTWSVTALSDGVWKPCGRSFVVETVLERSGEALVEALHQTARSHARGSLDDDFTVITMHS